MKRRLIWFFECSRRAILATNDCLYPTVNRKRFTRLYSSNCSIYSSQRHTVVQFANLAGQNYLRENKFIIYAALFISKKPCTTKRNIKKIKIYYHQHLYITNQSRKCQNHYVRQKITIISGALIKFKTS